MVSHIESAGLGRAEQPEESRRNFFLYLDEFRAFTTLALVEMLSELRKYHVGMVLAHQYVAQLEPKILDAILGNVGTMVCFRVGPSDTEILAREFQPYLSPIDLMSLPNHSIYVRLMIDGAAAPPFSAMTVTSSEVPGCAQDL